MTKGKFILNKYCYLALLLIIFINIFIKSKVVFFPFYCEERGLMWYLKYEPFSYNLYARIWYYPLKCFLSLLYPLFNANAIPYGCLVIITSVFTSISFFYFTRSLTSSNMAGLLSCFFYSIYGAGLGYMPYIIHQTLLNLSYGALVWSLYFSLKIYGNLKYYVFSIILGIVGIFCAPPRTLFFPITYFILGLGICAGITYLWKTSVVLFIKYVFAFILFILVITSILGINLTNNFINNEDLKLHNVVDGIFTDKSTKNFWIETNSVTDFWIELDLLRSYDIDHIVVYNTRNYPHLDRGTKHFRIGASRTNNNFKIIYEGEMPPLSQSRCGVKKIDVKGKERFVRVYIDTCYGHSAGLNEVKVYVKRNSKLYNVAYKKPVRISYLKFDYLFNKSAHYINMAILLNVGKDSRLVKYSFLVGIFIMLIFGISMRLPFMQLIGLGGISVWSYTLLMHILGIGSNYDLQNRHVFPSIFGFSLFWAGVFGYFYEKLLKYFKILWAKIFITVVITIPLVLFSGFNISRQYNVLNEHYHISKKSCKIRKLIAQHFSELNVPAVMYLQDENYGELFYNCFNGGIYAYKVGLCRDLKYSPNEIKYVTNISEMVYLIKNGWKDRNGYHKKISLENVYGIKLMESDFMDITEELRKNLKDTLNY